MNLTVHNHVCNITEDFLSQNTLLETHQSVSARPQGRGNLGRAFCLFRGIHKTHLIQLKICKFSLRSNVFEMTVKHDHAKMLQNG